MIETAPEVGRHILSGAVMDSRGLEELFTGRWKQEGCLVAAELPGDGDCHELAHSAVAFHL